MLYVAEEQTDRCDNAIYWASDCTVKTRPELICCMSSGRIKSSNILLRLSSSIGTLLLALNRQCSNGSVSVGLQLQLVSG